MKLNDVYPILLQAEGGTFHVADAVIIEIDNDEVTLEVPGVTVRMAVSHSLAAPKAENNGPDRLVANESLSPEDEEMAQRERDLVGDAPRFATDLNADSGSLATRGEDAFDTSALD